MRDSVRASSSTAARSDGLTGSELSCCKLASKLVSAGNSADCSNAASMFSNPRNSVLARAASPPVRRTSTWRNKSALRLIPSTRTPDSDRSLTRSQLPGPAISDSRTLRRI